MNTKKDIDKLSSGYFPGVWVLKADVSEHCVGSIFNRWWSVSEDWPTNQPTKGLTEGVHLRVAQVDYPRSV